MTKFSKTTVLAVLQKVWSAKTSDVWTPSNPAHGQCNVTAILIHDLFGADILKTPLAEGDHFYNRIGGERIDLTASQFERPIDYADLPSCREEALQGTSAEKALALRTAFLLHFLPTVPN